MEIENLTGEKKEKKTFFLHAAMKFFFTMKQADFFARRLGIPCVGGGEKQSEMMMAQFRIVQGENACTLLCCFVVDERMSCVDRLEGDKDLC
jgi:hypothetical protein